MTARWNPRYVLYAAAHGRSAEEQHEATPRNNAAFIAWVDQQWREFEREHPHQISANRDGTFDHWLEARVMEQTI